MVTQTRQAASFAPEDLGHGGIFDAVLTIKSGEFRRNQFTPTEGPNAGQTISNFEAKIIYTKEDGSDAEWTYSVGGADAWEAGENGQVALPTESNRSGKISESSAFGTFLTELVSAGFPANRLSTGRLDALAGTQIQTQGVVRKGGAEGSRPVLAAKLVLGLPGEVAGASGAAVATPPAPPTPSMPAAPSAPPVPAQANGTGNASQDALSAAMKLGDSFQLQQVMTQVLQDLASDEARRDAAAGYVFTPEFTTMLRGAGYTVEGYQVSK